MAKTKLLGFEFEGLPTVAENAEKMGKARARLGEARLKMLGEIKARKMLKAGKEPEMINVTPKDEEKKDNLVMDVPYTLIEEPKKEKRLDAL